jgi:protoporphyrin/coproporphyrin ferrochelatase
VCDYLRLAPVKAAILCPVGFLCDHVEVLYDLDVEAAAVCRETGIAMVRADAVNVHPRFIDALADAVAETYERYGRSTPLTLG